VNCDRCRELASEALDGALSGQVSAEFRAHVEACPPCGAFLAELRDSLALLTELPEVKVDVDRFDRAVWAAVRAEQRAAAPGWRARLALPGGLRAADLLSWRWAPAMAVGTVAVALAVSLGPNGGPAGPELTAGGPSGGSAGAVTPTFAQAAPVEPAWEVSEVSIRAPMPEPVEQYLQQQVGRQAGQELRLDTGTRLRGSDYFYPVRRVQMGTDAPVGRPVSGTLGRTATADPRPAVIAF
jgi:hypothetical protein